MNKEKFFAISSLIQVILLIGLFIYFIQINENFLASLTGAGIALSGLIMIIPYLMHKRN